jgi:hypothetical protein
MLPAAAAQMIAQNIPRGEKELRGPFHQCRHYTEGMKTLNCTS